MVSAVLFIVVATIQPYSLFAILTGWAFSKSWDSKVSVVGIGALSCFFGVYLGSIVAFLASRYIFREKAEEFAKKYP